MRHITYDHAFVEDFIRKNPLLFKFGAMIAEHIPFFETAWSMVDRFCEIHHKALHSPDSFLGSLFGEFQFIDQIVVDFFDFIPKCPETITSRMVEPILGLTAHFVEEFTCGMAVT